MPTAAVKKQTARRAPMAALCLAALAYAGFAAAAAGADGLRLLWCAMYAAVGVWLPGRCLAQAVHAEAQGLRQTASIVFGAGLLALFSALASFSGWHWLLWLLPAAGALGAWRMRRTFSAPRAGLPAAAACLALAVLAFSCVLALAHPAARGSVWPDHDFYWNLGNAESFLLGFPPADLRWAGGTLTYHWLTELLAAGFSMATGLSCYDALAFFVPAAMLAALAAVLWELGDVWFAGGEKARRRQTALLFALVFLGGCAGLWKVFQRGTSPFWNLFLRHLYTNVNGVATGTLFLAALAACAARMARAQRRPAWLWACALVSSALLSLAKGPVGGVAALALVCAAAAALLFAAVRREGAGRAARTGLFALAALAVFGILYALLFAAGAGSSVQFSAHATLDKSYFGNVLALVRAHSPLAYTLCLPLFALAQTLLYAPFSAPLALGGVLRDIPRLAKLPFHRLFAMAMAAGGFLAFYLFDHESLSQMYFAFAGLFFAHLLAVENARGLLGWCREKSARVLALARCALAALLAVSLFTGACTLGWFAKSALYPQDTGRDLALTAAEEEAMAWLAAHMDGDETFLTNRIHTGRALEGLSNVYSGLSGRRAYMEGIKYAISNLGVSGEEAGARVEQARAVFAAPDAASALAALPDGVDVIVFSRAASAAGWDVLEGAQPGALARGEEAAGLEKVFENEDVIIYRAHEGEELS